jgi:hypothetical protein
MGSWEPGALPGLAAGPIFEPVSVAAAGDGVAAVALTQGSSFQPGGDGRRVRVWVRDRPLEHFADAGMPSAGEDKAAVQPALAVDDAGRVLAAFLSFARDAPWPSRARVAIAVREPGQKSFGMAGLFSAPGASAPTIATSAAGRAVVTWTEGGRVQALSVEHGSVGRVVTLGDNAPRPPIVAVGPRGEAVVAWRDSTNRILAATRGRTGAFRRPARLGRPPMLLWDHPAVAVGRDGRAIVAWGSRVVLRGAAPRRGARCDRIQALTASTRSGRFGPLRRVDCAPNVSQPAAGPAGDGVVLAWTMRERIRGPRTARAALARDGSISRPTNVGDRHGSGSQTELVVPHGKTGASLIWLDTRPALPSRLVVADAHLGDAFTS